jgi:hypothetical protein
MVRSSRRLVASVCLALAAPTLARSAEAPAPQAKPPWGALVDTVAAGEIVLGHVCLPGVAEQRSIPELARYERLVSMPSRAAGAGPSDGVWRLASLNPVYAVAWADGSCSTYVDRGPSDKLRAMADRVIRARPEGFVPASSSLADGGRVERTVYCAGTGDARFVATITTPHERAPRGTRALSSTVYRAGPAGALCSGSRGAVE